MELYHFFVVLRRHASFGSHIDDHDTFLIFGEVTKTLNFISVDVCGTDFPKRGVLRCHRLLTFLEEASSHTIIIQINQIINLLWLISLPLLLKRSF